MKQTTWILGLLALTMFLMSCASSTAELEPTGKPENGRVVLETFVGEQEPGMHVDLLSWSLLEDSSIAITGKVLNAENAVLADVKICLLNDDGKLMTQDVMSDAGGTFSITSGEVSVSDHILFKHQEFETLDLVIKELKNSNEGMLVKYERVILP